MMSYVELREHCMQKKMSKSMRNVSLQWHDAILDVNSQLFMKAQFHCTHWCSGTDMLIFIAEPNMLG